MSKSHYYSKPGVSSAFKMSRASLTAEHLHRPADPNYQRMFEEALRELKLSTDMSNGFKNDCSVSYRPISFVPFLLSFSAVLLQPGCERMLGS